MGYLYKKIVSRILFNFDPEFIHDAVVHGASAAQTILPVKALVGILARVKNRPVKVAGINFRNPVGLAAGFDKNCEIPLILAKLGFGFLELGTITLRPQTGNPRPRLFRLKAEQGIINRMGFNNAGAKAAANQLEKHGSAGIPIGINIGKNADCSLEEAPKNYLEALKILYPYGDYFALNISSPNTLQLRSLHQKDKLDRLLAPILDYVEAQSVKKPLFVKLSPDLEEEGLSEIVATAIEKKFGLVISNTTVQRGHIDQKWRSYEGGLSGLPLRSLSDSILKRAAGLSKGRVPLIGVGGICDGQSAAAKLALGADLVQIYSGLIYEGPFLVRDIMNYLDKNNG